MYIYVIMEHKIDNIHKELIRMPTQFFMFTYALAFLLKAMSTAGVLTAKCQNYW